MAARKNRGVTLEEIKRTWPPTSEVTRAAQALGVSRSMGAGNATAISPPEPPPTPAGVAMVLNRRVQPASVQCAGCHGQLQLSVPPRSGEPEGWLHIYAGTPSDESRPARLLARCCSAECAAVILPGIREKLAELPWQPPDRPSSASTVRALMSERPRPR